VHPRSVTAGAERRKRGNTVVLALDAGRLSPTLMADSKSWERSRWDESHVEAGSRKTRAPVNSSASGAVSSLQGAGEKSAEPADLSFIDARHFMCVRRH
jgi:hypothetical protein